MSNYSSYLNLSMSYLCAITTLLQHFLDLILQVNSRKSQEMYQGLKWGITPNIRIQSMKFSSLSDKVVISLQFLCVG
jgi:hypothetical protein